MAKSLSKSMQLTCIGQYTMGSYKFYLDAEEFVHNKLADNYYQLYVCHLDWDKNMSNCWSL